MSGFDLVKNILLILPNFISLAHLAMTLRHSLRRFGLRWVPLPPESLLYIAKELETSLSISYLDQPIGKLTQYRFILHNTGSKPLDQEAIVRPLTWRAPGKILSSRVVNTDPPVELSLEQRGNQLVISWELFNQRCKALIEVRCEGDADVGVGTVSAQIRGVSEIREKEVYWLRDGVIIKITRDNIELLDALSRSAYLRRSVLRSFHRADWIALAVYAGVFMLLLCSFDVGRSLFLWIISALSVLFVSLYIRYRNPYTKFLQNTDERDCN